MSNVHNNLPGAELLTSYDFITGLQLGLYMDKATVCDSVIDYHQHYKNTTHTHTLQDEGNLPEWVTEHSPIVEEIKILNIGTDTF